jgi:hypothetical protein
MASIKLKGDTSGEITISSPSVAGTNTLELQATSGTLATTAQASIGMKNLIINGDMRIDQRNGGSAVTVSSAYTVDRFKFQEGGGGGQVVSVQQVTDAPVGFSNSFKLTNTTASSSITADAYNMFWQAVEGLNWSDLEWGTSDAKTATISFWVKASIAGNYSLAIRSSNNDRSYVTPYTISSANTWEYKTITIAGPTSGTFNTDNTKAIQVAFTHSMGSNYTSSGNNAWQSESKLGATGTQVALSNTVNSTWQITGVQLEVGTTATPFENLQYTTQLQLCQRYFFKWANDRTPICGMTAYSNTTVYGPFVYSTPMRVAPTWSVSAVADIMLFMNSASITPTGFSADIVTENSTRFILNTTGRRAGDSGWIETIVGAGKYIQATAEL